jgi:hypothetical protein
MSFALAPLLQKLLSAFFKSPTPAVLLMLAWCVIRIFFFEKLEANHGLGWDGARYADIATHLFQSEELDAYTIMRLLPSCLVHIFFSAAGIAFTPQNIMLAFQFLNTLLLCLSVYLTLKIFEHHQLSEAKKVLGLVLVFCTYATLNFPFYYTVMTDTAGFSIAIAALYFFTKGERLNLWLLGWIAAFTWPVALLQVLALLFFHQKQAVHLPFSQKELAVLFLSGFAWGFGATYYFVVMRGETNDMPFTLPIDKDLLWLSMTSVGMTAGCVALLLGNRTFFSWNYWKSFFDVKNILPPLTLLLLVAILISSIKVKPSGYASAYYLLKGIIYAAAKPFIAIVSSVNYFGAAILIALIFGKETISTAGRLGLGFAGAMVANLLAVGLRSEARIISNVFPWLAILATLALKDKKLSAPFYIIVFLLNLLYSKVWLKVNTPGPWSINADGTVGMPQQKFFMNLGPWMSTEVWQWLTVVVLLSFIILMMAKKTFCAPRLSPK